MQLFANSFSLTAILVLLAVAALARAECETQGDESTAVRVAISGMPFLQPRQARVGAIHGADIRLPQMLVVAMNGSGRHVALDYSHLDLRMLVRPRGLFTGHAMDSDIARHGIEWPAAEFVLTGVIENVGLASDRGSSFFGRYIDRSLALMDRRYNQPRRIALVVEMVNSATGELVMQKRYETQANWGLPKGDAMGVNSSRFWQSAYGAKLLAIAERVIEDVEDALSCAEVDSALLGS